MTVALPHINETDLKKIITAIQQLGAGRSNAVGTVTLATGSATTTVSVANGAISQSGIIAPGSVPILVPTTANAATEFGAGTWYISAVAKDSFTITHVNSATAGRTFLWAVLG